MFSVGQLQADTIGRPGLLGLCIFGWRYTIVELNYIFECDWLIELSHNKLSNNIYKLSNNKLSDNNLASELVENRTFLNQSQARKL